MEERGAADGDREGEEEDREHHPGAGGGGVTCLPPQHAVATERHRPGITGDRRLRFRLGIGVVGWNSGNGVSVDRGGDYEGCPGASPTPPPLGTWGGRGRSVG